jgi:hypothetical protein
MSKTFKLLFLASDPRDVGYRPTLDEEFRQIRKSLQASKYVKCFKLESEWGVQPADLPEMLSRHEPDIVHYSGHGNEKGLVMQNRVGRRTLLSKRMLTELFKANPKVRLVMLNACYSAVQLAAITETVDFTIGMNGVVRDTHAIIFAAAFYREIATGRSIGQAFKTARAELILQKVSKSKIPELKTREDADASFSFIAQPSSRPRTKTPKPAYQMPTGAVISAGRDIKESVPIIGNNAKVNQGNKAKVNQRKFKP